MKRLYALITAAALCFPSIGAWAWWQSIQQIGIGGGGGSALTYQSFATEGAGGTTTTYSAVGIGTADANRVVAVIFACRSAGGLSMTTSGVTIGGITATQVSGAAGNSAGVQGGSDIWFASVPTGTTANIVVTWSSATTATAIQVYSILTSSPAATSGNGASAAGTSLNTNITVPAGGIGISGVYSQGGLTVSWTNATADNHGVMTGGRGLDAAHTTSTGAVSITGTIGASAGMAMSSAAWAP